MSVLPSGKEGHILVAMLLVMASTFSILARFRGYREATVLTIYLPYLGYFLCGHYLALTDVSKLRAWLLLVVVAICTALVVLDCRFVPARDWARRLPQITYLSPPVIPMSVALFLLFAKIDSVPSRRYLRVRNALVRFTPAGLGIYLVHPLVLGPVYEMLDAAGVTPVIWISGPIGSMAVFLLCATVVLFLLKVPYLRRIV